MQDSRIEDLFPVGEKPYQRVLFDKSYILDLGVPFNGVYLSHVDPRYRVQLLIRPCRYDTDGRLVHVPLTWKFVWRMATRVDDCMDSLVNAFLASASAAVCRDGTRFETR